MANEKLPDLDQQILDRVEKYRNVSFAELTKHVDGFRGDFKYEADDHHNIVLWVGLSEAAGQAINNLRAKGLIELKPCSYLVYFCDGIVPRYPLAKQARTYKKPHWLPVVINPKRKRPENINK